VLCCSLSLEHHRRCSRRSSGSGAQRKACLGSNVNSSAHIICSRALSLCAMLQTHTDTDTHTLTVKVTSVATTTETGTDRRTQKKLLYHCHNYVGFIIFFHKIDIQEKILYDIHEYIFTHIYEHISRTHTSCPNIVCMSAMYHSTKITYM